MRAGAPAGGQNRPPIKSAVGHVGAPVRPTARVRPTVPVRLVSTDDGVEASDPYVRKFWVAALGPGAVAELLRLVSAAGKGEEVRLPRHLPQLLRTGLVTVVDGTLAVKERIPPVPTEMRWRFPPDLAAQHVAWLNESSS
ncbi:MAG TPA: hypothetical protein VMM14_06070 [Acidimicrobiia bacterium]|nr:hypothetical protein [Acidimicrobiia bacterium]